MDHSPPEGLLHRRGVLFRPRKDVPSDIGTHFYMDLDWDANTFLTMLATISKLSIWFQGFKGFLCFPSFRKPQNLKTRKTVENKTE